MSPPPGSGAVVMGSGIISISLSYDGEHLLSWIGVCATAAAWLAVFTITAWYAGRVSHDALRAGAAQSYVAASAVLGSLLASKGLLVLPALLLGVGLATWWALVIALGGAASLMRAPRPVSGSAFMFTVSIQSLVGLAALISVRAGVAWLSYPALIAWGLGLGAYLLAVSRFDIRELLHGHGDQWVAGGALAITALTGSQLAGAASGMGALHSLILMISELALAVGAAWLALFLLAEIAHPRIEYDIRRWSTVFPVGMYAASSFAVAHVAHANWLRAVAEAWTWVAVAFWSVVFGGMVASKVQIVRRNRARVG